MAWEGAVLSGLNGQLKNGENKYRPLIQDVRLNNQGRFSPPLKTVESWACL